jgi:hypothetical protein
VLYVKVRDGESKPARDESWAPSAGLLHARAARLAPLQEGHGGPGLQPGRP